MVHSDAQPNHLLLPTPYLCVTRTYPILSLKPSLWPLVTGIYPIPSAGSVYDDLVLFLHAFTLFFPLG